MIIQALTH